MYFTSNLRTSEKNQNFEVFLLVKYNLYILLLIYIVYRWEGITHLASVCEHFDENNKHRSKKQNMYLLP